MRRISIAAFVRSLKGNLISFVHLCKRDRRVNSVAATSEKRSASFSLEKRSIRIVVRRRHFGISRIGVRVSACKCEISQSWLQHPYSPGGGWESYKHKIAGMISSHPEDIRGGILADDMGLGKTLSMIASIVTGLSCVETTLETPADTIPFPVKSTLVVVPTERECTSIHPCPFTRTYRAVVILHGWIEEVER